MEIAPNIAVLGLMLYNMISPINVNTNPNVNALFVDILSEGKGLFFLFDPLMHLNLFL